MKRIEVSEWRVGGIYIIDAIGAEAVGLKGRVCKLLALDEPYAALLVNPTGLPSRHVVRIDGLALMSPSAEFIAVACPEEEWPDWVEVK